MRFSSAVLRLATVGLRWVQDNLERLTGDGEERWAMYDVV
jgi:hypothetical protein